MDDRTSGKKHTELLLQNDVQLSTLLSKDTALKQLIYRLLTDALSIYINKQKIADIDYKKLHLSIGRNKNRVLYISGMAIWVSKSHNREPMEVASAIVSHLSELGADVFMMQIVPPGWIYLEISDALLATWLQSLAVGSLEEAGRQGNSGPPRPEGGATALDGFPGLKHVALGIRGNGGDGEQGKSGTPRPEEVGIRGNGGAGEQGRNDVLITNTGRLFTIQYAYARCFSLVMLAHREGMIKLKQPLSDSSVCKSIIFTEQIPWLGCDQKLRLNHPDENRLITKLVQVVDNFMSPDLGGSVNWEKAGLNLSQAFESFWSKCRIWGEVKICSPELAQARLGLVMVTMFVLKFLLVEKLGVIAPEEL